MPFNDFNIERGVGYFIKSTSAGTITPSAPASRQSNRLLPASPDEVPTGPFQSVRDLRVSNLRDTSVTLSWTTDEPTTGYVLYGETKELGQVAVDGRGAQLSAETHYVTLTKLKPETRYYFKVVSGAESDRDRTPRFQTLLDIRTAPVLESLPESDTVYGKVFYRDGITPATGASIYLTLQDGDGRGDTGEATLLSALVDEKGYWHVNLGNARLADGRLFDYSVTHDELLIEVQGAGSVTQTVDTANDAPAPDIYLTNQPTSITIGAFNATLPSHSLLAIGLAALALTMLAGVLRIAYCVLRK